MPILSPFITAFAMLVFITVWWGVDQWATGDRKLIVCLLGTLLACMSIGACGWSWSYQANSLQRRRAKWAMANDEDFRLTVRELCEKYAKK